MIGHNLVLIGVLLWLPTLTQANNNNITISLSRLFSSYHLAHAYHFQVEKDSKYKTQSFKGCIRQPHSEMEAKYQAFLNLPEHRKDFQELEQSLNQIDQRGMGPTMTHIPNDIGLNA